MVGNIWRMVYFYDSSNFFSFTSPLAGDSNRIMAFIRRGNVVIPAIHLRYWEETIYEILDYLRQLFYCADSSGQCIISPTA